MENKKKFGAKEIATVGVLLAVCIVSQVFKNLSVYITGPIINLCLLVCTVLVNLPSAIALSIITPITAYLIAPSPVMQLIPWILLFIMCGNAVLCISAHFLIKNDVLTSERRIPGALTAVKSVLCALLKSAFMGLTISLWLLPTFIPETSKLYARLSTFQLMFSVTQFITAVIGFIYFFIVIGALKAYRSSSEKA